MPRLELRVESGENAHNSIDTQNGNIFWLRSILDLNFRNENDSIIHNMHAIQVNTNPNQAPLTHFTNPNDTTTSVLYVEIAGTYIQFITNQLNTLKQEFQHRHPTINFSKIVGEETIDERPLNAASLLKVIESIWFNFRSNRIYQDVPGNRVNSNHPNSHHYVNAAYDGYMQLYRDYAGQQQNNPLCYIHPLLFPRIFRVVFRQNQIPLSPYESNIDRNTYNGTILEHNLHYIQNQNTILYINRFTLNLPIIGTQAIQNALRNRQNIRNAAPAF